MKTTICKVGKQTLAGVLLASVMAFGTAQAEHLIVCASTDGLRDALGYLEFTNAKDLMALQGKLDEADNKELEGKLCDAAQKIGDFRTKMDQLVSATKPKVRQAHDDALMCIDLGSADLIKQWDPNSNCVAADTPPRGKSPKK